MTRVAIAITVFALAMVGAYYLGTQHDAAEDARATTDTIERIEDALDNPDGCAWANRLRGTCD